jgi:hypothetical protein
VVSPALTSLLAILGHWQNGSLLKRLKVYKQVIIWKKSPLLPQNNVYETKE